VSSECDVVGAGEAAGMSKLVALPKFNQPIRMQISLPHSPEKVLFYITIVILQDGNVDLVGHLNDEALATKIFVEGLGRLKQWHAGRVQVAVPEPVIQ
jgi:hypothetical protein